MVVPPGATPTVDVTSVVLDTSGDFDIERNSVMSPLSAEMDVDVMSVFNHHAVSTDGRTIRA